MSTKLRRGSHDERFSFLVLTCGITRWPNEKYSKELAIMFSYIYFWRIGLVFRVS